MTPQEALKSARRRIAVLYIAGSGGEAAALDLRLAIDEIDAALAEVDPVQGISTQSGGHLEIVDGWLADVVDDDIRDGVDREDWVEQLVDLRALPGWPTAQGIALTAEEAVLARMALLKVKWRETSNAERAHALAERLAGGA